MLEKKIIRNHKETGSRLAEILGFYDSRKFAESWDIVKSRKRHVTHNKY